MTPVVAVLGAINVDLVVTGAPLPRPGETVTGGTFAQHHGGKGGNQATAAARAFGDAGRVVMIGAVGDDDLGTSARASLDAEGVDVSQVRTSDAPTGVALITVASDGENQISVAPGANDTVEPTHAIDALTSARPSVLLLSLEIPRETARAAVLWCADHPVRVLLNPAPMRPWAHELVRGATWVTPNEHELAAMGAVADDGPARIVETRGADGAVIHGDPTIVVPAPAVDAVDTTGAGDCFNGVLATALAEGLALEDATRRAVAAASTSVTAPGARGGMPHRSAIVAGR
ncbi:MAG TPA: ribokinase [Actinomycetota bacterium]|nr:ribokinase [Actinomycetota bacterium]